MHAKTHRAKTHRVISAAAAAAIALTSISLTPAMAAPVSKKPTVAADNTDFSARRKRHRGYGNRAALGAFLGIAGTIATLAARDGYDRRYGYGAYGYAPHPGYGFYPRYYAAPVPYGYVPYY